MKNFVLAILVIASITLAIRLALITFRTIRYRHIFHNPMDPLYGLNFLGTYQAVLGSLNIILKSLYGKNYIICTLKLGKQE